MRDNTKIRIIIQHINGYKVLTVFTSNKHENIMIYSSSRFQVNSY